MLDGCGESDMAFFTLITSARDFAHLSQHESTTPADALALHFGSMPYDDGAGPFDEELDWLQAFADRTHAPTLVPVSGCQNTWMWGEGAGHNPQYLTYVVRTDIAE